MCLGCFWRMFAGVSCECCKSRSRCCDVVTISDTYCMFINMEVCKSRFRCFTFADVEFRCCRRMLLGVTNIKFNVVDVEFRWVSRRRGSVTTRPGKYRTIV
jgi:hypothetical protein